MSTSTTKQDTAAKTAPLAMYAVARHMLDHELPAPFSISPPTFDDQVVKVAVPATALDAWVDAIDIDAETGFVTEPVAADAPAILHGCERVAVRGQIAAACGLVRVEVRSIQQTRVGGGLVAVTGGAA